VGVIFNDGYFFIGGIRQLYLFEAPSVATYFDLEFVGPVVDIADGLCYALTVTCVATAI